MTFLEKMDEKLNIGVELIKDSQFYQDIMSGKNVEKFYVEYLKYAYHYVINSSSFTPLAARRMDPTHLKVRRWILEHSAEEMGHELMALKDLEKFGHKREDIIKSKIPVGVMAWVSFFHYKVAIDDPFCAFGVLYFLEGMATMLAPGLVKNIINSLDEDKKKAITFFREHGDLDADHLSEQKDLLKDLKLAPNQEEAILNTIEESAVIKRFMLDQITKK